MTAVAGDTSVAAPGAATRWLRLLRLDLRSIGRGAFILGALTAGLTAVVVLVYPTTVASPEDAAGLELLAGNPAIRLLFGVPRALDTAGGFAVWRIGTIAAVAIAAWALAVSTRLGRGEEDSGRSWMLLAAPIRLRTTVVVHLGTVVALLVAMAAANAVAMAASGAGSAGALLYAAGLAAIGWFFAAVGACGGQLLGERSLASGSAGGVLVVALVVKMVGDGLESFGWIRWLTPFGMLSLSEPYAQQRWLPLAVLTVAASVLAVLAVWLAGRRDVGAGLVSSRNARPPRTGLLTSPVRFAIRRSLPSLLGWGIALVGYFLLIGMLAVSLTEFLSDNPRFADLAATAGFGDLARVEGYVASLFKLLPIPLGIYSALRIARLAADEARGRLTLAFSTPVRRVGWPLAEALVVTGACLLLVGATAAGTWLGAAAVDAGLAFTDSLAGTANALPVALLSLGAAVLALGWLPRAVVLVGALPTVGGFIWWVLAESLDWPDGMLALSPYAHLGPVPAAPPDLPAAGIMLSITGALLVVGLVGFGRRDLRV